MRRRWARSTPRCTASILDVFNEYGVQIMTPAYEGDPEHPEGRAEGPVVQRAGEGRRRTLEPEFAVD